MNTLRHNGGFGQKQHASTIEEEDHGFSIQDQYLKTFASFLPCSTLAKIRKQPEEIALEPHWSSFEGVLMMADLSGFTKLCEDFAHGRTYYVRETGSTVDESQSIDSSEEGWRTKAQLISRIYRFTESQTARYGAEGVLHLLANCFGSLIEEVEAAGGDIIRVAGDALIVVFPVANLKDLHDSPERQAQKEAAKCAATCAVQCVERLSNSQTALTKLKVERECQEEDCDLGVPLPLLPLQLHVGLAMGTLTSYCVGGTDYGWQEIMSGLAFTQVGEALHIAAPGDVVASSEVALLLQDCSEWKTQELKEGYSCLMPNISLPKLKLSGTLNNRETREKMIQSWQDGDVSQTAKDALWGFTPLPVYVEVVAEETRMLSEIQRVTVLFAKINITLNEDKESSLKLLQQVFRTVQGLLNKYEGILKEFTVDDKGMVVIVGFGLRPHIGHRPSFRACLCALDFTETLSTQLGTRCFIGVTTGPVFCASLGSKTRKEFAFVSDTVNIAAGLMIAAQETHNMPDLSLVFSKSGYHAFNFEDDYTKVFRKAVRIKSSSRPSTPTVTQQFYRNFSACILTDAATCYLNQAGQHLFFERLPKPPRLKNRQTTLEAFLLGIESVDEGNLSTLAEQLKFKNKKPSLSKTPIVSTKSANLSRGQSPIWHRRFSRRDSVRRSSEVSLMSQRSSLSISRRESDTVSSEISVTKSSRRHSVTPPTTVTSGDGGLPAPRQTGVSGAHPARRRSVSAFDTFSDNSGPSREGSPKVGARQHNSRNSLKIQTENPKGMQRSPTITHGKAGEESSTEASNVHHQQNLTLGKLFNNKEEHNKGLQKGSDSSAPASPLCYEVSVPGFWRESSKQRETCRCLDDDPDPLHISREAFNILLPLTLRVSEGQVSLGEIVHCAKVDPKIEDLLWVRCGGRADYLQHIAYSLHHDLDIGYIDGNTFWLKNSDLRVVQELACYLPPQLLQQEASTSLDGLDLLETLLIKVASVIGGFGDLQFLKYIIMNSLPYRNFFYEILKLNKVSKEVREHVWEEEGQVIEKSLKVYENVPCLPEEDNPATILENGLFSLMEKKILQYCYHRQSYLCDNVLFLDSVYHTIPHQHRAHLHLIAVDWLEEKCCSDEKERERHWPSIVHHAFMSENKQKQKKALVELKIAQTFNKEFLRGWVLDTVSCTVPSFASKPQGLYTGSLPEYLDEQDRACFVLPAIPWLRGLAKAIRTVQVVNPVTKALQKFLRIRQKRSSNKLHDIQTSNKLFSWHCTKAGLLLHYSPKSQNQISLDKGSRFPQRRRRLRSMDCMHDILFNTAAINDFKKELQTARDELNSTGDNEKSSKADTSTSPQSFKEIGIPSEYDGFGSCGSSPQLSQSWSPLKLPSDYADPMRNRIKGCELPCQSPDDSDIMLEIPTDLLRKSPIKKKSPVKSPIAPWRRCQKDQGKVALNMTPHPPASKRTQSMRSSSNCEIPDMPYLVRRYLPNHRRRLTIYKASDQQI